MRFNSFVGIVVLLMLTGCVYSSHPDYPRVWSGLVSDKAKNYLNISGVYLDEGEKAGTTLSWLLYGVTSDVAVTHVKIVQQDFCNLEISLWNNNLLVKKTDYKLGEDFSCNNREVVLSSERQLLRSQNLGLNYTKNVLMKNEDGWLVLKNTRGEYGLLGVLIPIASEIVSWHRFKPMF